MKCPKDLIDKVNANPDMQWFLYDLNLLPEVVTTVRQVCALRGFVYGWEARELAAKATP